MCQARWELARARRERARLDCSTRVSSAAEGGREGELAGMHYRPSAEEGGVVEEVVVMSVFGPVRVAYTYTHTHTHTHTRERARDNT